MLVSSLDKIDFVLFFFFFLISEAIIVDNICSILFKPDGPVHAFLNKCSRYKSGDAASAVSQMLEILCTFLKKRKRNNALQKYAKDLMVKLMNTQNDVHHARFNIFVLF